MYRIHHVVMPYFPEIIYIRANLEAFKSHFWSDKMENKSYHFLDTSYGWKIVVRNAICSRSDFLL